MSTHKICFYGELEKIIRELSSNTHPYQVPRILPWYFTDEVEEPNVDWTYIGNLELHQNLGWI